MDLTFREDESRVRRGNAPHKEQRCLIRSWKLGMNRPPNSRDEVSVPLIVDVNGDLLIEGAARLLATSPRNLVVLLVWLVGAAAGRASLKRRTAQAVALLPDTLVLNPAVIEEIVAAKAAGRTVWLASAADELMVAPFAETLEVTGYLASDGRINLAGRAKADALVERFGEGGFDYIGNERRDLGHL